MAWMDQLPCETILRANALSLLYSFALNECVFESWFVFYRIGVSEKGQATVKLTVNTAPGHSSMPPKETSIGILASAVRR